MSTSSTGVTAGDHVLCPRCRQGVVIRCFLPPTGEELQVCEECDATWPSSSTPDATSFDDFATALSRRGLHDRWAELVTEVAAHSHADADQGTREVLPRLVRGTVTRHEPYGFFVDVGERSDGLVRIVAIEDDPGVAPAFPAVGREVEAVLLGYAQHDQPWLSMLRSDRERVSDGQDDGPSTFSTPPADPGPSGDRAF